MLALTGCEFKDVELDGVDGIEINKVDEGKLDATFTVRLTNPNSFPIKIKSGEFDLYMGKVHMGDAKLKKPFKIPASSTESYDIEVDGSMGDVLAAGITGLAGLLTGKQPQLDIKGTLKAGNLFYTKEVDVQLRTDMPVNL